MTRVDDVGSSCSMCGNSNILGDKETFELSTMHSHSWLVSFVSEIEMVVNEFVNEYKCDMGDTVFVTFNDVLMLIKKTIQVIGDVNVNVNGMNVYYAYLNELLMKGIKKCEEHKEEEEACNDKVDDDDHSHLVLSNQNIIDKISKKISMAILHKKKMINVITCNNNNQFIRSLSQTKMNSYSLKYKDKLAKKRSGMGSVVKRNDTCKRRISEEKEKEKEKKNVITMEIESEFNYNYKKRKEVKSMKVSRQSSKEKSNVQLNLNENEVIDINEYSFDGNDVNGFVSCNGSDVSKKNLIILDDYKKKLYGGKNKK